PVELSAKDASKAVADIAFLGDDAAMWGLREEHGRTYLSVDRYAEAVLPHAIALINNLMAETAVERLAGVGSQELMAPPADTPSPTPLDDMFSFDIRSRVRRLGGL